MPTPLQPLASATDNADRVVAEMLHAMQQEVTRRLDTLLQHAATEAELRALATGTRRRARRSQAGVGRDDPLAVGLLAPQTWRGRLPARIFYSPTAMRTLLDFRSPPAERIAGAERLAVGVVALAHRIAWAWATATDDGNETDANTVLPRAWCLEASGVIRPLALPLPVGPELAVLAPKTLAAVDDALERGARLARLRQLAAAYPDAQYYLALPGGRIVTA